MSLPIHPHGQQSLPARPANTSSTLNRQVHTESGPTLIPDVTTSTTRQNLYLALHDFIGQSQDELSLRKGDILHVVKQTDSGKSTQRPA